MKEGSNEAVLSFEYSLKSEKSFSVVENNNVDETIEGLLAMVQVFKPLAIFYNETVFWLNEARYVAGPDAWLVAKTLIEESVSRIDQIAIKKGFNISALIDGPLVSIFKLLLAP